MASLKKLAGETIWYGLSNIAARFLNVLLTPIVTYLLHTESQRRDYGDYSVLYACIAFINVIYTYGMETAYFRFASLNKDRNNLFQTAFTSLFVSSLVISIVLILNSKLLCDFTGIGSHPEYITWCILIVAIDTMAAIPFARLRQEGRPRKYAFTRIAGILVNIFFTICFIYYSPAKVEEHPYSHYALWYKENNNAGFLILANLFQSIVTFLLLLNEWKDWRFKFDLGLWKQIMKYGSPMLIIGLGGMVNETIDRIMLRKMLPVGDETAKLLVGNYSANYKIAIFITLFIQAFKMSAEPFFFAQAADKNAPKTYARVMKWFVITLCIAFLFTGLYLEIWKYFVGPEYRDALGVVPILLAANVCLGVYYNLSVWYKITNKMYFGIYITLFGSFLTLIINYFFIPRFGMFACAWATLAAYGSMMILSYLIGQKYFPVPYPLKKLLSYLGVMLGLFMGEQLIRFLTNALFVRLAVATWLFYLFIKLVLYAERKELSSIPLLKRIIKPETGKDKSS